MDEQQLKYLRVQGQKPKFQERAESPNERLRQAGYNPNRFESTIRNVADPQQIYSQQQPQHQQDNNNGWRDVNMNNLLMQRMNQQPGFNPVSQQRTGVVLRGAALYTEINIGVQNPVVLCKKVGDNTQNSQVTLSALKQCYVVPLNEQRVDLQAINSNQQSWKQLVEIVTGMGQKFLVEQQHVQQQGFVGNRTNNGGGGGMLLG
jgi:hypothetical protein